jgi:hypothetical protein
MSHRSLAAWRRLSGLCGTALILLVLALLADGMIAGGRSDPNEFRLIPGQSVMLTDLMPRGAERLEDLELRSSHPGLSVRMQEVFSGFWLGGTLWRAEATLAKDLPLGEHSLSMHYQHNGTETTPRQAFRIHAHKDAASIQAAALSFITRHLGLSPYLLAVCLLPLALLPMFASLLLSRRIARTLADQNMTEVYRAMASADGQLIFFSLAQACGLKPGDAVDVLDDRAKKILGAALVTEIKGEDLTAVMQNGLKIRPGVLARPASHN